MPKTSSDYKEILKGWEEDAQAAMDSVNATCDTLVKDLQRLRECQAYCETLRGQITEMERLEALV